MGVKVLLLYPNKWGRGITPIWAASHAAHLRRGGHEVRFFDCTFYTSWSSKENNFNTRNNQYRPSGYEEAVSWRDTDVVEDLVSTLNEFRPDVVASGGITSQIHGEGEYINPILANTLISNVRESVRLTWTEWLFTPLGLYPTYAASHKNQYIEQADISLCGETEVTLKKVCDYLAERSVELARGVEIQEYVAKVNRLHATRSSENIDIPYDYSIFPNQLFLRAYHGQIVRAADYEISRGCPYTCSYCVETAIQDYYGYEESNENGLLLKRGYLVGKTEETVLEELESLCKKHEVRFIRFQDTNFLSNNRRVLGRIASYLLQIKEREGITVSTYIETRPESISASTIRILKSLNVAGVGMGVEASSDKFRYDELSRSLTNRTCINAFRLLRDAGICRTAYNVIGFPSQTSKEVEELIELNAQLDPDDITVAFYTPYPGTALGSRHTTNAQNLSELITGESDPQLSSTSGFSSMSKDELLYYKHNFVSLCRQKRQ